MKIKYWLTIVILVVSTSVIYAQQRPKVGLALSGGGALGFAHMGAIQALEEVGIEVDCVAGSSMGAIIGVLYAAGYSPVEIVKVVSDKKLYKIQRLVTLQSAIGNMGMSTHAVLRKVLKELIPANSFDSLELQFAACVTNLDSGEPEYKDSGALLAEYVAASASIPGVFEAVTINGATYVDGGVTDNLPAGYLRRQGCRYVIGVDVLPFVPDAKKHNSIDVALWSIRLMQHKNAQAGISACDWLIESRAIEEYHEFGFENYREIYQYGYRAALDYIARHPEIIKQLKHK